MRETKNLEYKIDMSDSFLRTVSAYANYGDGKIIFGVSDEGVFVGLNKDLKDFCLTIENKINSNIIPRPHFALRVDEGKKMVELMVFEGDDKPYLYKNRAYKRSDSSTIQVDRIELNRLILKGFNKNFEDLPAKKQDLSFNLLENELKEKLKISKLDKDILKTLKLYSQNEGYNNAAELLADENTFVGVDIAVFGETINEFLSRDTLENVSVLAQYNKAVEIYQRVYQYEKIEGMTRKKVELIPEKAFREALVNSIVHREWDLTSHIRIAMFKDRIEITSPGGLPNMVSEEEYLYRQVSWLRNPILGNIFFLLKYIEKFGTGITRINKDYEESIIKPQYKIFKNSISIILPIFIKSLDGLTEDEKSVYILLRENGSLTRAEIEEQVLFSKDKTIRILNALIRKNSIQRKGTGRNSFYEIL